MGLTKVTYSMIQGAAINVLDFGAVGDGVTDDSAAIQSAITAAEGSTLYFPEGIYNIGSTTLDLLDGTNYVFASTDSVIKYTGSGSALQIDRKKNLSISSGTIDLSASTGSAVALSCTGVWFLVVDQTKFVPSSTSGGIYLTNYVGWGGSYIVQLNGLDMSDTGGAYGIKTDGDVTHLYINGGWIKGKDVGIDLNDTSSGQLTNTVCEACTTYSIKASVVSSFVFQPGELSGAGMSNSIYFDPATSFQNYVLAPSAVGDLVDYTNYKPAVFDRNQLIVRGSIAPANNNKYYAGFKSDYVYDEVLKIYAKADISELAILTYGASTGLRINTDGELVFKRNDIGACKVDNSRNFVPFTDSTYSLGTSLLKWSVVYAATGTINTSDNRNKQDVAALDDAEKRVAVALKGLIKKFRFKDAVEAKGDDARIHVGVIAQEVVAAFQAEGLDANKYGLLCYDEWNDEYEDVIEEIIVKDEYGNDIKERRPTGKKKLIQEAGNRYGIRYDELLAFIISVL